MHRLPLSRAYKIITIFILLSGVIHSPVSASSPSLPIFQVASSKINITGGEATPSPEATIAPSGIAPVIQDSGNLLVDPQVFSSFKTQARVDFWLRLRQSANLAAVPQSLTHAQRATYVYRSLTAVATTSQSAIVGYLQSHGLKFESHWIVNAILVYGATASDLAALEAFPEVFQVLPRFTVQLDDAVEASPAPTINTDQSLTASTNILNWGLTFTHADQVWNTYNDEGAGIVVANIDTGVMYTHPALVSQYRGTTTGSNDYNWFMPSDISSSVCTGTARLAPCDDQGHGTHTMGIMVGDDGTNQTGMAPQAQWIACKAFSYSGYATDTDLTTCAEWILAPTDLQGNNPDPTKAPDIVNNSWGEGIQGDTWYQSYVQAWVASGIFPSFSNGNLQNGDTTVCGKATSPGDLPESFASGAIDQNGNIANFSYAGPGGFDNLKPDLVAPGVEIESTYNNGNYKLQDGTSMASPHTAGAVALLWSALPTLRGNVAETVNLLDSTANPNTPAGNCGAPGSATSPNYTYGHGYLDALALVHAVAPSLAFTQQIHPTGVVGVTSFALEISNPVDGEAHSNARLNVVFENTNAADIQSMEFDDGDGSGWQPVTSLAQNGSDVTGYIGSDSGFQLTVGYEQIDNFRITWTKSGTYPILFQLVDLSPPGHILFNLSAAAIVTPYQYILPLILNNAPWP